MNHLKTALLRTALAVYLLSVLFALTAFGITGDVNSDGGINIIDARICLQIALGFIQPSSTQSSSCDVNGDGQVTLADAQQIAQYAIGQISSLAGAGFSLTISKEGTGTGTVTTSPPGINCGSICSANYPSGTQVSMTALPDGSSTFNGWSGDPDCSDGQVILSSSKSCTATFNTVTSGVVWQEGFESYSANSWPTGWIPDANALDGSNNFVDNNAAYKGVQSLRLFGAIGGCWGALAFHPLTVTPPFEIQVAVRNGNESLYGCHPDRGYVGLREGYHWYNPSRPLVSFLHDGTIRSGSGLVLGTYSPLIWYLVRIRYERPSPSTVVVSYWINGDYKGSDTLPAIPDESNLTNLDLTVQEGSAWFDAVEISH